MGRRIIEIVALLLGIVITVGVVIAIPMKSYNEYKEYLAEIEKQNEEIKQQAIKPVLDSITAELKEGIRYFANDLAEARPEHFIVTANYTKEGQEPWSEPVEEGDFTISTPSDFYAKGGQVVVKYKGVSTTIQVALEPVVLEAIEITVNPYTIKYQAGTSFDASGMTVTALYNDGSSKVLAADQYTVDEKILAIGDTSVAVSFTDGEVTKTADVEIGVSEVLDNGAVASIIIVDGAVVYAGQEISTAAMEVNAVYENGNRRPLSASEYSVEAAVGAVEFGKMYHLTVSYNADPTKTARTDIKVRQTLQGEDGIIVGGSVKTEAEYAIIDGVITELENSVTFAGAFSKAVLNGEEANLTLRLNAAATTVGDITVRCSNSYNVFFNGSNANDGYMMKPLQINTILDLTVNGREVKVPATVILRGCGPHKDYAPLYGIYYEFTFEDVELDAGINNIRFNFKKSTVGATNCWGESPSTLNIDCVHFDTFGSEIPDDYTIVDLEISDAFAPQYGERFDEIQIPVVAILDNGTKIGLSKDLYDITITGGEAGAESFGFGKYVITAALKENPSITASHEIEIPVFESFVILTAGVEIVDGRVLYVFTGNCTGYEAEDIELFDGGTVYPIVVEITGGTFRFYVDVTETGYGLTYWPHVRLDGVNYDNGANKNGDVRDRGLQFTNGQSVVLGDRSYTITTQYSMPTLVVEKYIEVPVIPDNPDKSYDADLDNSYVSDKVLIGEFVYGSEGTETSGTDKNSQYAGGIGNMDKLNKFVTYTFTLDKAGKVDFIWNIAGSYWNGSGNSGLENAKNNLSVAIDGVSVDMDGIALPAGEGDNAWWNIQQVIVKDVELDAGTHTFTCIIITDGAGLNVGSMEIYSSSATAHVHTEEIIPAVEADCTKPGSTAGVKCSECGEILKAPETIPQKDHTKETIPAVDPDCTNPGLTAGVKCSVCKTVLTAQTSVPATGHAFDHSLDADCNNGCGFVRDVSCSHSFTGPVLEGADGFYQKCDNEHCSETQAASAPVADSYKAVVDNSFASARVNAATIVYAKYGAWGVATNGDLNTENGAPAGAIGGLDKGGKYVYYEFYLNKPGTVDIIWNIAGSNWDGSGNAGIDDMASYMTITVDGKAVDIAGITLPAGEGSLTWWNLQQLVLKDVALDAGVHSFKCDIKGDGGLNVGPMVIKSNKDIDARSAIVTKVDLVARGDKMYYALTAELKGYTASDIKLWGDNDLSFTTEAGANGETLILVDVTNFAINQKINPHMSVAGKKYINSENGNGDVFGSGLSYEEKTVKHGDKYYQLFTEWSMPTLIVLEAVANVTKADLFVENDRVYYTLTYNVIGYDPATFEFFDGSTIYEYESYSVNGSTVVFKFDVTDYSGELWPHLRINGANWDGDKGDVKVDVATKTIQHNGRTYTLKEQWDMPTVVH